MLTFQRITTADAALYQFMERLLTASFPEEEYRDLDELRAYTDTQPKFANHVVLDDENPVGLLTCWDFGSFCYVEHLAVDASCRNGGYGARIMQHLCHLMNKPVVLEVELPDNDLATRRIGFYQRQGFVLWEQAEYRQPPYRPGGESLPMLLMVHGDLDPQRDFEPVRYCIYKEVYGQ